MYCANKAAYIYQQYKLIVENEKVIKIYNVPV